MELNSRNIVIIKCQSVDFVYFNIFSFNCTRTTTFHLNITLVGKINFIKSGDLVTFANVFKSLFPLRKSVNIKLLPSSVLQADGTKEVPNCIWCTTSS